MGKIVIECADTNAVSDGYHTFGELYEHRCALFCALVQSHPGRAWRSLQHDDGSSFDGWFIAGMKLPSGEDVTYHLPMRWWGTLFGIDTLDRAPKWDGHTSNDVLQRIGNWARSMIKKSV